MGVFILVQEEICPAERVGRHEEKFANIEERVRELNDELRTGQEEIKNDIKTLIQVMQQSLQQNHEVLSKRVDRMETGVLWFFGLILTAVGGGVFAHVFHFI